jgi:hypothetical protein
MVAVSFYQIVTVATETTIVSQFVQRLVQLLRSAVEGSHVYLASKSSARCLSRWALVNPALASVTVFSSGDFYAAVMQTHSDGKQIVIRRAQIIDIQQHLCGLYSQKEKLPQV